MINISFKHAKSNRRVPLFCGIVFGIEYFLTVDAAAAAAAHLNDVGFEANWENFSMACPNISFVD